MVKTNIDPATVQSFGAEWGRFSQDELADSERLELFNRYFAIFPWDRLPPDAEGFDMGCGSGRWAALVSERVARLNCIDPSSKALAVAMQNLASCTNVTFINAGVSDPVLEVESQDFGYSLGVLHHVPDTAAAIEDCVRLLKPGAPFLLYLYYRFDNRPGWFRALWSVSETLRRIVSSLPELQKDLASDILAFAAYIPLSRAALLGERAGLKVDNWPLSSYRRSSIYTLRTDSRDRFGTPLEQRFTRAEMLDIMEAAGLTNVTFSDKTPYWTAVGYKR